jgi:hypothetical protein
VVAGQVGVQLREIFLCCLNTVAQSVELPESLLISGVVP